MISSSYSWLLNGIALITITLPVLFIVYWKFKHDFKFFFYLLIGISSYIIMERLLTPFLYYFVAYAIKGDAAYSDTVLFYFVAPFFYAAFDFIAFFLMERFIFRKNLKVTDTTALAVFYYIFPIIESAVSFNSYARIAKNYLAGTLEELVNESLTLEELNDYVSQMASSGFWVETTAQVLNRFAIMLCIGIAAILIYHGIMKKKPINYLYAFLLILGEYLLTNSIEYVFVKFTAFGLWAAIVWFVIIIAAEVIFFIQYYLWYKKEKINYQQQLKNYRNSLKTNK